MVNRSEIRNACYRAKKGVAEERHQHLLDMVRPLLQPHQTFNNFPVVWDVMIKDGSPIIVKPETDYNYIHNTLLEAALYHRQGIDFDSFNDRQMNIITIVDSLMLDGVMEWETYNKIWGVSIDPTIKQISTSLYKVADSQIEVTDEMIRSSMKDADGSALTNISPKETVLHTKPMDDATQKAFEEFLAKKYKKD